MGKAEVEWAKKRLCFANKLSRLSNSQRNTTNKSKVFANNENHSANKMIGKVHKRQLVVKEASRSAILQLSY